MIAAFIGGWELVMILAVMVFMLISAVAVIVVAWLIIRAFQTKPGALPPTQTPPRI